VNPLGQEIARFLPHRHPFLLVDRVTEFEPDKRIVAIKNVTWNEPHFTGHFPDRPIMPGVLICEAMAQAGGLLVHGSFHGGFAVEQLAAERVFLVLTSLDNVKFRRQVVPGDQLRLEISLLRRHRPLWKMRGVATVDGQVVAQADFSAVEVAEDGSGHRPENRPVAAVRVHPTAMVAREAKLDTGVEIGPYSIVGPHVSIGRETWVGSHACVDGHTTLGAGNKVFPHASVGSHPQDRKYRGEDSRLVLGDRNHVREFASVSVGTEGGGMETVIGDDNLFMNNSHVGHDCRVGNDVVLANGVALAGHVVIGDHAIVSGLAAVAQFVRVGESAFVGGGSMVVMDVPPFCMANGDRAKLVGLNVVGLERRGFTAEQVSELKRAYRLLFQSKLLARDAVERIRGELAGSALALALADFTAASERGVTRP
jgi:UDP-N-acetylglucosamine acyltransferase